MDNLIKPALGAVIGFVLAQLVNVGKLIWAQFTAPRLKIEYVRDDWEILSHTKQLALGEYAKEVQYGFRVRNVGRRIATGVRFQLLEMEVTDQENPFYVAVAPAANLTVYVSATHVGPEHATIVPGASVLVSLATWTEREDGEDFVPNIEHIPDYFEEATFAATKYRFRVVVFDESGRYASEAIELDSREFWRQSTENPELVASW
jgi:hypothetical protein